MSTMTQKDREALGKLIRQRERLAKTAAAERSARLMADFEAQLDRRYDFDEDAVWQAATAAAQAVVAEAQRKISERCKELRIPEQFAPGLSVSWHSRGRNAAQGERAEMRRIAKRRIESIEAEARLAIEKASVAAQEKLLIGSLSSDDAHAFIAAMPTAEQLMPTLAVDEVQLALSAPRPLHRPGTGEIAFEEPHYD